MSVNSVYIVCIYSICMVHITRSRILRWLRVNVCTCWPDHAHWNTPLSGMLRNVFNICCITKHMYHTPEYWYYRMLKIIYYCDRIVKVAAGPHLQYFCTTLYSHILNIVSGQWTYWKIWWGRNMYSNGRSFNSMKCGLCWFLWLDMLGLAYN